MDYDFLKQVKGAIPKPEPRQRTKARAKRQQHKVTKDVRTHCFEREMGICRFCRVRRAESLHEVLPRGAGGKVSKRNSVALCGQLVGTDRSCHTWAQLEELDVEMGPDGAEGELTVRPTTARAAEWLRIPLGKTLVSRATPRIEERE